jgi:hypothetical protein
MKILYTVKRLRKALIVSLGGDPRKRVDIGFFIV